MALFPSVGDNFQSERAGVNAIAVFASSHGMIWRENIIKDVGIDGQIEYVTSEGKATGRLVAVQVKSGPSYFKHDHGDRWVFYPNHKHLFYWERFPIPVILVLHSPANGQLAWIDVRQHLRRADHTESGVGIPKTSNLLTAPREEIFRTAGVNAEEFVEDLEEVLKFMAGKCAPDATFPVSYIELFSQGLTNIVRSLYFGMDLVSTIAEVNLAVSNSEFEVGIGGAEHEFLFDYVRYLVSQDLAAVDFGDCLIDWQDRQMHPHFVAPLTSRGRKLVEIISVHEGRLRNLGLLNAPQGLSVAQERFMQVLFTPSDIGRIPLARTFADLVRDGR